MKIKVGCDLVEIRRFNNIDRAVLSKLFHKSELRSLKAETLAGMFAMKESCKKVFNDLDWLDIEIKREKTGKPILNFKKLLEGRVLSYDVSISHDAGYAIAVVVFLINDEH